MDERRKKRKKSLLGSFSVSLFPSSSCSSYKNTNTQKRTHFLSREVVGGQQSSYETNVDLKHRHLGILGKQEQREENSVRMICYLCFYKDIGVLVSSMGSFIFT